MNKQRIVISRLPTTHSNNDGETFIEVAVSYDKGGTNMFTRQQNQRGYWLSFSSKQSDGVMIRMVLGAGTKYFLEPANRFSEKKLNELASQGKCLPKYQELLDHVLAKEGLTLA